METQTENMEKECYGHCHGRKNRCLRITIRIVIAILVLGIVFSAGFALGKASSFFRYGIVGRDGQTDTSNVRYQMMNGDFGKVGVFMMGKWRAENKEGASRIFGSILKIEGAKITISDNGGKEQVVLSGSDTVIMTQSGEISLSNLKAGQTLTAFGKFNKDNQFEAETISVPSI
jgi:hypothetical protein